MQENENTHIVSYQKLTGILAVLLVLTGITVGASTVDLGKLNVWTALFIASIKSSFVVLFFMRIKSENQAVIISFVVTIFCLALLIGFIFFDIAFR